MRTDILEQAKALKAKIDKNQQIVDTVEAAGGITVSLEQSDKLGFDWRVYAVNNVVVRREYEKQANPAGTADNPLPWTVAAKLIPNGYYTHDGVTKVWTGESGVTASWDDAGWEAV
nr:MAG TPA: hypothetical protein [Caudoviricetes sp.]